MAQESKPEFNAEDLAPEWRRAIAYVEEHVGGRVVRAERQARWRPAWFCDVETSGGIVPIYFRGARGEAGLGVYTLDHEGAVLEVLATDPGSVEDFNAFCETSGDDMVSWSETNGVYRYTLRKKCRN